MAGPSRRSASTTPPRSPRSSTSTASAPSTGSPRRPAHRAVAALLKVTGDWQKYKGEPGAEGTLKVKEPKTSKKDLYEAALANSDKDASEHEAITAKKKADKEAADKKAAAEAKAAEERCRAPAEEAPAEAETTEA